MPKPADMTTAELEQALLVQLSTLEWHDLTEVSPDPEAVQCLGAGLAIGRKTIYMLTRYEGEGDKYALVAQPEGDEVAVGAGGGLTVTNCSARSAITRSRCARPAAVSLMCG